MHIQVETMVAFLVGLLGAPSPTGYDDEALTYTENAFAALGVGGLRAERLPKGALVLTLEGTHGDTVRGITAHADTLGLMVKEIKPSGRLKVTNIGGISWHSLDCEGVTIRTLDDRRIRGTVVPNNPSGHVNANLRTQERSENTMEVRLDARVFSAGDVRALGIEVGDFVFVDPRIELSDTGFIRSRFLDNKAGVAVIYGALVALRDAGLRPAQTTRIFISNYEEVGHGGAVESFSGVTELLTVDMGAVGDGQQSDEYSVSICIKDSSGPYHHGMTSALRRLADAHAIPYKVDVYPGYSSDGSAYWRAGGAGRVALIGPGIEASHSYERTHRDSLEHTAHLIARYLVEPEKPASA